MEVAVPSSMRCLIALSATVLSILFSGRLEATDCAARPELVATSPSGRFRAVLPQQGIEVRILRRGSDNGWQPSHTLELGASSVEVHPQHILVSDDGWLVAIERWCYGGGPLAMVWDAEGNFRYGIDYDALPEGDRKRSPWQNRPDVSPYSPPVVRGQGPHEEAVVTLRSEHRAVIRLKTSDVWVEEVHGGELPDDPEVLIARADSLAELFDTCSHSEDDLLAVRLLRRALEIDRGHTRARLALARELDGECAYGAARRLLEDALERAPWTEEPEDGPGQRALGLALAEQLEAAGEQRDALVLLQEQIVRFPEDEYLTSRLAAAYFRAGAERDAAELVWGWAGASRPPSQRPSPQSSRRRRCIDSRRWVTQAKTRRCSASIGVRS